MTKSEPAAGRQHLAALLRAAGSVYDPPGLEALLRGVLGAPAEMGGGWHRLVADPMPPPLAAALDNFYAELRAAYSDGLSDAISPGCRAPRAWQGCAPSWSSAASTGLSCRARTNIRANMCRRAASGWPG